MEFAKKATNSLIELVYPRLCAACEDRLKEHEKCLCLNCHVNLPQTHFHNEPENPMFKKFWGRTKIEQATALYYFTAKGKTQRLIHNLKYNNQAHIGEITGNILGERMLENEQHSHFNLVIPVPLHKKRFRKRGYNQSDLLAKGIANKLGIEWSTEILKRITDTATQTKKSRWERWKNVSTIFQVTESADIQNKHILLVDDVMTTGATLEACTEKLLAIEGVKVSVATIAWASN